MKTWITFLLLSFIFFISARTQSSTHDIIPKFQQNDLEYVSDIIDFTTSFSDISFVGISSYHFDDTYKDIKYLVLHGKKWSQWLTFSPQHEMGAKIRTAYEGQFITAAFSALQFKTLDYLVTPLTIRLFIGKRQESRNVVQQRSISCTQPEVCDRSCWCPDCPIDSTPQYTTPTHVIVHHSAGSNQADLNFTEVVNYIWDLHVNTNGWDDIGYNWLIDPNGVLYEGRPDGYQGAHFSCINENTIGICLLGDFTMILPSDAAVNTLVNIIAYEATEHNIDVISESYHETGDFNLVNVAGHRDSSGSSNSCSSTACPGDTFYPTLVSIRNQVADLDCFQNSISGIQTVDKGLWSIFPNPFQNTLKVLHKNFSHSELEIKDITGQTCGTLFSNQAEDLSHLANGVYFIMHEGQIIEKVIKQQ